MAETIKYVSLSNLTKYDEKIKEHIDAKDAALKTNLEGQIEVVANALDSEITTARANEATNAAAAQAAQKTADDLKTYVGTFEASDGVDTVVKYIDAKTANIASDETVSAIANRVTQTENDIDALEQTVGANKTAIEGTVSKLEEKVDTNESDIEAKMTALTSRVAANETAVGTTLPNAITAEQTRAEGKEAEIAQSIAAVKEDVDAFFADADMTESAKDTLKELQAYIASDETGAASMAASIKQNSDDIDALEAAVAKKAEQTALDAEVTARTQADSALDTRLKAVEGAVGESGSVATDIADAKSEAIDSAVTTAAADATSKANQALVDAKTYADNADNEIKTRVDTLEAASATHAKQTDLTALTTRVTTDEGEIDTLQTEMDAVQALADAADKAAKANAAAIALKASQADLDALEARVDAVELWQENMIECTETDINNLFAAQ